MHNSKKSCSKIQPIAHRPRIRFALRHPQGRHPAGQPGRQASAEDRCSQLTEEEVQTVSREVAKITSISANRPRLCSKSSTRSTLRGDYVVSGGIDYARKLLVALSVPEHGEAPARPADQRPRHRRRQLRRAAEGRPAATGQVHPQRASADHRPGALAPEFLAGRRAADLAARRMRADVALRMASLDQISPEIITKIAAVIGQKLKALANSAANPTAACAPWRRCSTAWIPASSASEILDTSSSSDPNLAETIRHLMFVFEDLLLHRSQGPQGSAGQGRPQGPDGGAQGHQRTVAQDPFH